MVFSTDSDNILRSSPDTLEILTWAANLEPHMEEVEGDER